MKSIGPLHIFFILVQGDWNISRKSNHVMLLFLNSLNHIRAQSNKYILVIHCDEMLHSGKHTLTIMTCKRSHKPGNSDETLRQRIQVSSKHCLHQTSEGCLGNALHCDIKTRRKKNKNKKDIPAVALRNYYFKQHCADVCVCVWFLLNISEKKTLQTRFWNEGDKMGICDNQFMLEETNKLLTSRPSLRSYFTSSTRCVLVLQIISTKAWKILWKQGCKHVYADKREVKKEEQQCNYMTMWWKAV